MGRNVGLPGMYRGAKAHGFFMNGHADGYCGRPKANYRPEPSKACKKAYDTGYERGTKDREKKERGE